MEAERVLVGLIGAGLAGSRSPALHEEEARQHGLHLFYHPIDLERLGVGVEALPDLLTAAQRLGFAGVNITHPCKQAVLPLLDELSADAQAIGAVNTVVFRGGKRLGHNTDCWGFAESFRLGLPGAATRRVLLAGAGGAGAAVAHALLTLGVQRLAIHDKDPDRAGLLAGRLCAGFGSGRAVVVDAPGLAGEVATADGVVHATPMGMAAYPGVAFEPVWLTARHWLAEVVYMPLETELLRVARARGCRTLDGGGMAVYQAAAAFRLFTGRAADPQRMRRHFESLGEQQQ